MFWVVVDGSAWFFIVEGAVAVGAAGSAERQATLNLGI